MDEAVQRYDALRKEGVTLPAYAERNAADALLAKRRPAEAAQVYEDSIARDPGPYDAAELDPRIGLTYAYLESEQTTKALTNIDELAAKEQPWVRVPGIRLPIQNPRKFDAESAAISARSIVDMQADAYARIVPLSREAPADSDIRRQLGMVELARGWPRRAQDDLAIADTLNPRDVDSYLDAADTKRALHTITKASTTTSPKPGSWAAGRTASIAPRSRGSVSAAGSSISARKTARAPAPTTATATAPRRPRSKAR